MITGKNQIGFSKSAKGEKTYRTINPKTNSENDTVFFEATQEEIDLACKLAQNAATSYSLVSGSKRATFLRAIADEVEALGTNLTDRYQQESGLPEGRANGELGRTLGQLRMFANLVENDAWRMPTVSVGDQNLRKALIPLGPVAVFGASNFPLAFSTAGGDTASALAAGCPVVVKSHPMHSGVGEMIATAIIEAANNTGMPEGVFSNLNSAGIEVGKSLVKHPAIKAVGFTGSHKGGRALYDLAAQREVPIPVFAEMGSVNPVIITQKALEKRGSEIAQNYAASITQGAGQFCTNPGLILTIKSKPTDQFIEELSQEIKAIDQQCMLHPDIAKTFKSSVEKMKSQKEVSSLTPSEKTKDNFASNHIATVSGQEFIENKKLHQEVFGPFSLVVQAASEQELLDIIKNLEGQLTATIIAQDEDIPNLEEVTIALQDKVGRIIYNGVPTGVAVEDAMTHGGPYPASTDSRFTAVGTHSILRWVRPFSYQGFPDDLLPDYLK